VNVVEGDHDGRWKKTEVRKIEARRKSVDGLEFEGRAEKMVETVS
jgi:hypothetical protein